MNKKLYRFCFLPEKVAPLHPSTLAMYRGSVSRFSDLSITIGAAPRHVQRVRFRHLKSADFLETRWGPPLFEALVADLVAMMCDADVCS